MHISKDAAFRLIYSLKKVIFCQFGLQLVSVLLASCASLPSNSGRDVAFTSEPQREAAFRQFLDDYTRLNRIAFNVERAAAPLCKSTLRYAGGIVLATPKMATAEFTEAARNVVGGSLIIYGIAANSPAEEAGFRVGDVVEAINNRNAADPMIDGSITAPNRHETWVVQRAGQRKTIGYDAVAICNYPVKVVVSNTLSAATDGKKIVVSTATVQSTNDDELALVIGHELAHIVMGHLSEGKGLYEIVHSTRPDTEPRFALEAEADYVGSYLAAGAGYDMHKAADLWRKIGSDRLPGTHPPKDERLALEVATADEIERKRAAGAALVPDGLTIAVQTFPLKTTSQ